MFRQILCLLAVAIFVEAVVAQSPERKTAFRDLQHRWEYDPDLGTEWLSSKSRAAKELDIADLESPNLQVRLEAMQMAIRDLATHGISNRQQAFGIVVDRLQTDLDESADLFTLLTDVSAASELASDREQMEQIWNMVAERPRLRQAIERKLLEYESPLPLETWRERLTDPRAGFGELLTALNGLESLGEASDAQRLRSVLENGATPTPIRLQASQCLGTVASQGLEQLAEEILATSGPVKYQLAANLLRNHDSQPAAKILQQIVSDGDAFAKAIAYRGLVQQSPQLALSLAPELVDAADDNLRLAAIKVLSKADDVQSLSYQASRLADVNLQVRQAARTSLRRKASVQQTGAVVDDAITHFLTGEAWQGIEQAILLSVELKQDRRADTIIGLLEHPFPQVNIRAAWALQNLQLQPENLQSVFEKCQATTQKLLDREYVSFEEEIKTSFLFEALGVHRYKPASEMLELYIPKNQQIMKTATRTSAIYALGLIWEDSEKPAIADQLVARMLDGNPLEPEQITVQYMAAVALGRMGAKSEVSELRKIAEEPPNPLGLAREWAIEQLAD